MHTPQYLQLEDRVAHDGSGYPERPFFDLDVESPRRLRLLSLDETHGKGHLQSGTEQACDHILCV
jgi:hypothetical protein